MTSKIDNDIIPYVARATASLKENAKLILDETNTASLGEKLIQLSCCHSEACTMLILLENVSDLTPVADLKEILERAEIAFARTIPCSAKNGRMEMMSHSGFSESQETIERTNAKILGFFQTLNENPWRWLTDEFQSPKAFQILSQAIQAQPNLTTPLEKETSKATDCFQIKFHCEQACGEPIYVRGNLEGLGWDKAEGKLLDYDKNTETYTSPLLKPSAKGGKDYKLILELKGSEAVWEKIPNNNNRVFSGQNDLRPPVFNTPISFQITSEFISHIRTDMIAAIEDQILVLEKNIKSASLNTEMNKSNLKQEILDVTRYESQSYTLRMRLDRIPASVCRRQDLKDRLNSVDSILASAENRIENASYP